MLQKSPCREFSYVTSLPAESSATFFTNLREFSYVTTTSHSSIEFMMRYKPITVGYITSYPFNFYN